MILKYNKFNESYDTGYPSIRTLDIEIIKDYKYDFLLDICKRSNYEQTNHFFVKDVIEIGMIGQYKLYLNYISMNEYDKDLSFWFVYNEKNDNLYGKKWNFGTIWEEDGLLNFQESYNIELYPNFIDIIFLEIKSYKDLDDWITYIKNIGINRRKYHRILIKHKGLTWEEKIGKIKNDIESEKLLDRRYNIYHVNTLKNMLELGEEKWNEKIEKENKWMNDIMG